MSACATNILIRFSLRWRRRKDSNAHNTFWGPNPTVSIAYPSPFSFVSIKQPWVVIFQIKRINLLKEKWEISSN
jgi:hypothetical protein